MTLASRYNLIGLPTIQHHYDENIPAYDKYKATISNVNKGKPLGALIFGGGMIDCFWHTEGLMMVNGSLTCFSFIPTNSLRRWRDSTSSRWSSSVDRRPGRAIANKVIGILNQVEDEYRVTLYIGNPCAVI